MPSNDPSPLRWPGFRNGGLLLPLPDTWFTPTDEYLTWQDVSLRVKPEFHVTLLNQTMGSRVRDALGVTQVKRLFEDQDWAIFRNGDGALLHKQKPRKRPAQCASVIEHISLPALGRFRAALSRAAGVELPDVPPHVTLYAGGDPAGIGLPSFEALGNAAVASFRLPGIASRSPPVLPEPQLAAYCAADYTVDALEATVRVGEPCPLIQAELLRRDVERAVVVTAYNPFSEQAHDAGNQLRQQLLLAVLEQEGFQVAEAEGRDPDGHWAPEPSLLVFGTTPQLDDTLLRDFEQHAIVLVTQGAPPSLVLHPDQPLPRSM